MSSNQLSHLKYRPDIDGLRAVAVLSVVIYHFFPALFPSGFIGVDIFFVISGYLISLILFKNFEKNSFGYGEFYKRRILRIFPALFLVLLSVIIVGYLLIYNNYYKAIGRHILGGAGFVANFFLITDSGYFDVSGITKPLRNLWSLGVEEQFYIIWPLLIGIFWKVRRQKFFLWVTFLVGLASFIFNISLVGQKPNFVFYSPWTRFWELMIGGALAYLTLHHPKKIAVYPNVQSIIGVILLITGFWYINDKLAFPGYWALLPCLGAFFIIAASSAWINRVILSNKLFVAFGLISYPLYLWHWPILSILYISRCFGNINDCVPLKIRGIAVVVSIILAWATYQFVEKPIRFNKKYEKTKTIILCMLMSIMGIIGYVIYQKDGLPSRFGEAGAYLQYFDTSPPNFNYLKTHHIYENFRKKCNFHDVKRLLEKNEDGYTRDSIDKSCYTKDKNSSKTIFIWGDSHAESLYIGLKKTLPSSVSILQVASSACGPDLVYTVTKPHDWCQKSNHFALSVIKKEKPDIVLLAQYKGHYIEHLRRIVGELKKIGIKRVLVVGPDPAWVPDLNQLIAESWHNTPKRMKAGLYTYVLDEERNMKAALKPIEDFEYVSLLDLFCNKEGCLTYLNNDKWEGITTFDNGHLSKVASVYVAKKLLTPLILNQTKIIRPSLNVNFNQVYTFNSSLLFANMEDFSPDEPSPGIWTQTKSPQVTLYLSKEQLHEHPNGEIKIQIQPFVFQNLTEQRTIINWGNKQTKSAVIKSEQWISLPYRLKDWEEVNDHPNLEKMVLQFNLLDAISPYSLHLGDDSRLLGLRFMKIEFVER